MGKQGANIAPVPFALSRSPFLEEIGNRFGITRARVRQIESEALEKLRMSSESDTLRSLLELNE